MKTKLFLYSQIFPVGIVVASIAGICSTCFAGMRTETSLNLSASASRPALSLSPVISGSTAIARGWFLSKDLVHSLGSTDIESGGGAEAYGGADSYSCILQGTPGLVYYAHSQMFGSVGIWPDFDTMYSLWTTSAFDVDTDCITTGFGAASGTLNYSTFPAGTSIIYQADFSFESWVESSTGFSAGKVRRDFSGSNNRLRYVVLVNSSVVGTFQKIDDQITASSGWGEPTVSSLWGVTTMSFESDPIVPIVGGGGELELAVNVVQVNENTLDLNGDGRFDEGDVTWLAGEIPSTDPGLIALANLVTCPPVWEDEFCEEVVDENDLNAIQALLDLGLGSVKFGDRNGDGCVTCADAIHGDPDVDDQFDDVDTSNSLYNIGLDANGDGVIDATDRAAFYALVNHADLNGDTIVDDADALLFDDYYNELATAEGDQNGDGYTDDADWIIFLVQYNEYFCPTCS